MNTELIIVDGHSSVGKSSVSKSVYKQIALDHDADWLHEECENHPIRHKEFSFGELNTAEGMELNRIGMLKKWMEFRDSIKSSGKVCVTEGCFLHAYDRYFNHSLWKENEIVTYCSQVLEVINELNPCAGYLTHPSDFLGILCRNLVSQFLIFRPGWVRFIFQNYTQNNTQGSSEIFLANAPFTGSQIQVDPISWLLIKIIALVRLLLDCRDVSQFRYILRE